MSAAIRRNWKTIVPLCVLLFAFLFGVGVLNLLRADDEPPSPPVLYPDDGTQSVIHLPGVEQRFQFTLTERTSVTFTTTEASPDTALFLYGPNDTNALFNAHWPDYLTSFRVLSQVGDFALEAGTYHLVVTELAGGMLPLPFAVEYFTGIPTNIPTTVEVEMPSVPADPTNAPALSISSIAQEFTHTPGVDQWFQFTLLEPTEVTFTAVDAGLDTALLLYGPDDSSLLVDGAWPDFFTGLRILSRTGANALVAGTYYFLVSDVAGGIATAPFNIEYWATPVVEVPPAEPPTDPFVPPVEEPTVPAFVLPIPADYTNNVAEIVPSADWQSFDYTLGTTQWVCFTFTQRTALTLWMDFAMPDTQLVLYGPDGTTNVAGWAPPDVINFWRVLEASGDLALVAGTYILGVIQTPAESVTGTYPVWFTATTAPEPETNSSTMPEGENGGPASVATSGTVLGTAVATFIVTNKAASQLNPVVVSFSASNSQYPNYGGTKNFSGNTVGISLPKGVPFYFNMKSLTTNPVGTYLFREVKTKNPNPNIGIGADTTFVWEMELRPHHGASGVTRQENGQPLAGVQLYFDAWTSGPDFTRMVTSAPNGTWTNRLFGAGTTNRVTPFLADATGSWVFTPPSLTFTSNKTDLNFTARRVPNLTMSGSVAEASTGFRLNGAKITFQNLSIPNGFCPIPTFTSLLSITNANFITSQPGLWRQGGFASNIGYRIIPSVAATGSTGGKWTFNPARIDVTNQSTSVDFTATYVENPANLYTLSGKVTDTATGAGLSKVLVHFSIPGGTFASVPTSVLTAPDGTWMQSGFQKSNFHGEVTYYIKASVNTNIGPGLPYLPREGPGWIISEDAYPTPTAGNAYNITSTSRKTGINFIVTSNKYALDYTVMLTNGFVLTAADWLNLTNGLRQTANYLYDATDGQVIIKSFTVANYSTPDAFRNSNIQLLPSGYTDGNFARNTIRLSADNVAIKASGITNQWKLHEVLVHEMGHAYFALFDEYTVYRQCDKTNHVPGQLISVTNGTNVTIKPSNHGFGHWLTVANFGHADLARSCATNGVSCIMDRNKGSEFCVVANHNYKSPSAQQETNNAPCWVTMKKVRSLLDIPSALPKPGPGATVADSKEPLPWDKSAARHVKINGP